MSINGFHFERQVRGGITRTAFIACHSLMDLVNGHIVFSDVAAGFQPVGRKEVTEQNKLRKILLKK
jgi:hypothetical protein